MDLDWQWKNNKEKEVNLQTFDDYIRKYMYKTGDDPVALAKHRQPIKQINLWDMLCPFIQYSPLIELVGAWDIPGTWHTGNIKKNKGCWMIILLI